jgi:VWFA-related protein
MAGPPVEVILIVDEVNTAFTNVANERNGIEKFLRRNDGALAQPVSILFFSDSGVTATAPSRVGNALIEDLNHEQGSLRSIKRSQGIYGENERIQLSLNVLTQLAGNEAAMPGRKLVVWVGPGWPFLNQPGIDANLTDKQKRELFDSIVAVSDELRRARITLYAADPLGLADARRTAEYLQFSKGVRSARQAQYGNLALQVLAYQSGGRVLNSGNDVAGEIAECVADANAFYVLSFDALGGDGPDEYHALEVKIGKPGLAARTRSGYYAQPEPHRQ